MLLCHHAPVPPPCRAHVLEWMRMDVPRFTRAEVNAHLVEGDLEEAFSRFARDAKGKRDEVRQPIEDWLGHENNRLLPVASFVYRAWLNATNDLASVKRPLGEWLVV